MLSGERARQGGSGGGGVGVAVVVVGFGGGGSGVVAAVGVEGGGVREGGVGIEVAVVGLDGLVAGVWLWRRGMAMGWGLGLGERVAMVFGPGLVGSG